jgi:hypothetical protein
MGDCKRGNKNPATEGKMRSRDLTVYDEVALIRSERTRRWMKDFFVDLSA